MIIVSLDGYATVATFKSGFFGEEIVEEKKEEEIQKVEVKKEEGAKEEKTFKSKKGKTVGLRKISL